MIEKALSILKKKHLLIVGKSEVDRNRFLSQLIEKADVETFRFPKGMKSLYDYIDFVRTKKLYHAWYSKKGKFGTNQILEFHSEWIDDSQSLVVLEEFQDMEEGWKLDIIRSYLEKVAFRKKEEKTVHLVVTQELEDGLFDKLESVNWIPENDNRTMRQVIAGSLHLLNI